MTQQQSSSPLSVEDMEKVMNEIDNPTPAAVEPTLPAGTKLAIRTDDAPPPATRRIAVKVFVDPEKLKADTEVDPVDLDNACLRHSGLVAHYGVQRAAALQQFSKLKTAFEILEAQLYEQHRSRLEVEAESEAKRRAADESLTKKDREKGAERVTDTAVNAAMKADPRWFRGKNRVIDAEAVHELAKTACNSLEHRRDMIITFGANARVERAGELRIAGQANAVQSARDRAMDAIRSQTKG